MAKGKNSRKEVKKPKKEAVKTVVATVGGKNAVATSATKAKE